MNLITTAGRTFAGLVVDESDEVVTLKTTDKKLVRIARDEVEVIGKSPQSLMPNSLLSDLSAQEAADLLAYIRSLTNGK